MNAREAGFLLLSSTLGNPERKPQTTPQLRTLALRAAAMDRPTADRELTRADLTALGYGEEMAGRILRLLEDTQLLQYYLARGKQSGCVPLTRVSQGYPAVLRRRLGLDSPGVMWARGDLSILERPMIALVGSRDIAVPNGEFAAQVGRDVYLLKKDNKLYELTKQESIKNVLFLSEEGFDQPFTSIRALSRNRVIHALGEKTLVAQCAFGIGGTWSGTVRNLKEGWSPVFCFRDGSDAFIQLEQLGAGLIDLQDLRELSQLKEENLNFFGKT